MSKATDDAFQKGYQAALADLVAVIEDASHGNEVYQLTAVETYINNNLKNKSMAYRGYWIEQSNNDSVTIPICFDIYASRSDVGKKGHIYCVTNLPYAKKLIDEWARSVR